MAGLPALAAEYQVVDVGELGTGSPVAHGVNDAGAVVGESNNGANTAGTFWGAAKTLRDLGDLGEAGVGRAYDVNASGQVAGFVPNPDTTGTLAYRWTDRNGNGLSDAGDMVGLGVLDSSHTSSTARGINASGHVVGVSGPVSSTSSRAFLWKDSNANNLRDSVGGVDEMIDLGAVGAATGAEAYAVNDAGQVVGRAYADSSSRYAFRWTDVNANGVSDAGELVQVGENHNSTANGINDLGHVVGTDNSAAFLWVDADGDNARDAGEKNALPNLSGFTNSFGNDVNDAGVVVGQSVQSSTRRGFVWDADNGTRNVNDLIDAGGWVITNLTSISDTGYIAGVGQLDGDVRQVLLVPVPEPAVAGPLALLGVLALRRRRGGAR